MSKYQVLGQKAGSKPPRQPVIAPDSAQSKTYIKILYGLSEGEIGGLEKVYLDDTPTDEGNFAGLQQDFRKGTNDQDYIEGFPDISNETQIGIELKSNTPWTRSFTNLDLDAVRVRLQWGALRQTNASNGDVTGVRIEYAIDVQTDGRGYVEVLRTEIRDKTSANYERSHRIDLPPANNGWQVRVRRITPNSTSEYISDKMYISAVTEVIDLKLRYPNTALLGLQYDAETFGQVAKMAALCKGKIIKVPTNYNPENRTYIGMWDGTFKQAYSNNPAWIYYDICTSKRYGLGDRLQQFMIDKWSLYKLGQYCDDQVDDGEGGLEPRFTLNVYLQTQEDAYAILQKIAGVFRAVSFWDGEKIVCDADAPSDTHFTYTMANVIDGIFEYTGSRARDRHTVAKVAWDNPQNRFKTEYEFVRDEQAIGKLGVRIVDIDAWGCTSRGQAQRAGLWALKSEQLETRQVTFKVGLDGYIPKPYRIIEIADPLFAGRANGGRVSKVSADKKTITLDRDAVAATGDALIINGEDGQAQRRIVASVSGRNVTVTLAFTTAAAENVWVIDAKDLATMKFRVMSVVQNEKHQFTITALQYNAQKYNAIDSGAYVSDVPISIINPTVQLPVASVTISSTSLVTQGVSIETMIISYPQADGAVKYQVEWLKDDGSWIKLPITGNNSVEVQGIYAGNYQARVTAINAFDMSSLPTYSVLTTLTGKVGLPPKLAFIKATGVLFGMKLDWGFPTTGALDTAYTEIEVSPDGVSNIALLGQFSYPTNTHTIQGLQPNLKQFYRGRLIDRIGNKGAWSDWTSGTSTADADDILELLDGQITSSQLDQSLREEIEKIPNLSDAIQKERDDRIIAIQNERDERIIAIQNESTARVNAVNAEKNERVAAISNLEDGVTQEIIRLDDKDAQLLQTINTNKTSADQGFAAVQQEITTISTDLAQTAEKTDGVYAITHPKMMGSTTDFLGSTETTFAGAWSIQSAFASADLALSKRIDTTVASIGENTALIQQESIARVNADNALATQINTVQSSFEGNLSIVKTDIQTLSDEQSAQASQIDSVVAKANNNSTLIQQETTARVNADNALGTRIDTVSTTFNNNLAAVQNEVNTLADEQSALAEKTDGVYAITHPKMMGSTTDFLGSTETTFAGAWSIQYAFASEDLALSKRIDTVVASVGENTALIQQESIARVNADNALATQINTIQSDFNNNLATVQTDIQTLSTQQGATASQINTLQTTVNGNTASIQTQQQSINGLNAQYTIKLDVNGLVGGIGLANSGSSVDFVVRSNKFAIAPPVGSGNAGKYAFVYQNTPTTLPNGTVVPAGLYVSDAVIGSISANKINATELSAISANLGTFVSGNPSGQRVVINDKGLRVFNSGNIAVIELGDF